MWLDGCVFGWMCGWMDVCSDGCGVVGWMSEWIHIDDKVYFCHKKRKSNTFSLA